MLNLVPTLTSVLLLALLIGGSAEKAQAQGGRKNLAAFDTKAYHFGFALSGNRSDFNLIHHADFTFSDCECSASRFQPRTHRFMEHDAQCAFALLTRPLFSGPCVGVPLFGNRWTRVDRQTNRIRIP